MVNWFFPRNSRHKREALAALKRMPEVDPEAVLVPDEPDLQPFAAMPEFKAMKEKMKAVGDRQLLIGEITSIPR
jgi:hypothetical protein